MARYFFHVEDGTSYHDDEGVELASLADAKCEALRYAGRLICDAGGDFWDAGEWCLRATDENGLTLFSLTLLGVDAPVVQVLSPRPAPFA